MEVMKTVCIYHSIDLDGWMSAAIVKHYHENMVKERSAYRKEDMSTFHTIDFIGYNYGQPIPDLTDYDRIIMCDISFPKEAMTLIKIREEGKFVWIDHHISAINDTSDLFYNNNDCGLRDTKFAACELTWMYFFPNEPMPEIVRLLGRYDCFGHKNTDEEHKVLEFQYGARMVISNYEQAYDFLLSNIKYGGSTVDSIHIDGAAIYRYLCSEAKQIYKNGFEIEFIYKCNENPERYNKGEFIAINKERFNPINFGIDYHKDGYDGCACFHYANGMWNFSLYNDNGLVDCSIIAKQYGGGGHKGAAGFRINDINKIINV